MADASPAPPPPPKFLEHHAVCLEDLLHLSNNFDAQPIEASEWRTSILGATP
jgi:hypothetical protein